MPGSFPQPMLSIEPEISYLVCSYWKMFENSKKKIVSKIPPTQFFVGCSKWDTGKNYGIYAGR